jgi:hypothetical protein
MLSECGCVPSPVKCQRDGTVWSAWCVWCYEYVLSGRDYNEAFTSADTLKTFYEADSVVTLADVPAFGREEEKTEAAAQDALAFSFADGALSGSAAQKGEWVEILGNEETDGVKLTITVPRDGEYTLVIRQAGIGGYKENYLTLDGETLGNTVAQGEEEEDSAFGPVTLTQGEHEIGVAAFWGWVRLKTLTLVPLQAEPAAIRAEFEEGEILGNAKAVNLGLEGWVELASNDETDGVTVRFSVPESGKYDLIIRQAGIGGYKENYLAVDGQRLDNTVVQGQEMEDCVTPGVTLEAGEHTVTVTCFWGWAKLDSLTVTPAQE